MKEEKKYNITSGPLDLLGIAFIVLKLCGVVDWSWWGVLCPFWIQLIIVVIVVIVLIFIEKREDKRMDKFFDDWEKELRHRDKSRGSL